ncbi:hypothetical protein LCGC14_1656570, partial [marine sediment metagenome]
MPYKTAIAMAAEMKNCDEAQLHYKFTAYLAEVAHFTASMG